MFLSLNEELRIFFYSGLCGVLIMLLYDIVSVTYRKDNCSITVLSVCDGIVVVAACAITVFIILNVSRGMVRFYEFIGLFLGAILYKLTLSRLFCPLFSKILYVIYTFSKIFFKILLTPLLFMYKMINRCISRLFCPLRKWCQKVFSRMRKAVLKTLSTARKTLKKT